MHNLVSTLCIRLKFFSSLNSLKRRRAGTVEHCDYLAKPTKSTKRIRTDPAVTFATFLEEVHTDLR